MRFRPTPATVIAGAACFFALGGSALALSDSQAARPQSRCAAGAVRGVAAVTGGASVPGEFTSSRSLFARVFNCAGGPIQVRRVAAGVFEVRFSGNRALANGSAGALASVEPAAGGGFRVSLYAAGRDDQSTWVSCSSRFSAPASRRDMSLL
jgi:hypothetical protein